MTLMDTDPDRCQIEGCIGYADWIVVKRPEGEVVPPPTKRVCRSCRDEMIACYGWELAQPPAASVQSATVGSV